MKPASQFVDRQSVISIDGDRTEEIPGGARPGLNRLFHEAREWHSQGIVCPTFARRRHADLLNHAIFPFHDHNVIQTDRARQRELDAGKQIRYDGARGKAEDQHSQASPPISASPGTWPIQLSDLSGRWRVRRTETRAINGRISLSGPYMWPMMTSSKAIAVRAAILSTIRIRIELTSLPPRTITIP